VIDPYKDWGPDPGTLAQIARRSGCVVELAHELHDGTRAYELKCPSHAAKVQLLANLADFDAKDPDIMRLAERLASIADGDPERTAAIVHAFVRDGVRFVSEPREKFQPTGRTLSLGIADCDDSARAVYALAKGAGLRPSLMTLGDPPRHVSAAIQLGGNWRWADASLAAYLGEHPIAAAKRLGLKVRGELADLGQVDGDAPTLNIPNMITAAGFSLGVAWSQGGPDWTALVSVAADELDGYMAGLLDQRTEFGADLDWATDFALTPLVWKRLDLPFRYYPALALGQLAARRYGLKPGRFVPSIRSALMLFDIGRRALKRRRRR
jgi:transglutaminase-like putative cysteine protease